MPSPVALITGASSGIGAEFAKQLASKGYDLLLVARREEVLKKLCYDLSIKYKIKANYFIEELADLDQVKKLEEKIKKIKNIEMLINNAGFGVPDFFQSDINKFEDMIVVHDIVTMRLTKIALNRFIEQGKSNIINVSSIAGIIPLPNSPVYNASKSFVKMFTESLSVAYGNKTIRFQALCPGFTTTQFHKKIGKSSLLKNNKKLFMTAKDVVSISLKYLDKNKVVCMPGFKNKLLVFLYRLLPSFIIRKLLIKQYGKKGPTLC